MNKLLIPVAVIALLGDAAFAANDQEDQAPPRRRKLPYAEHDWTKHLTSTVGAGYIDVDLKDHQPETEYDDG